MIAAIIVAGVLSLVGAGWTLVAHRAASQLSVDWLPNCADPSTVTGSSDRPVLHLRQGWRCTLELSIANDSGRAVHVRHIMAPFIGPGGGAEIVGHSTLQAVLANADSVHDIDAMYDLDLTVPAHGVRTVNLSVEWRETGCNEGGLWSVDHWPTVEFSVLHRTFRRSAEQPLVLRLHDDPHTVASCTD